MLRSIEQLVSEKITRSPDAEDEVRRAQQLAESVINHGFPLRSDQREDERHHIAVELLVRPCVVDNALTSNDFRYFDFLGNFAPSFFQPFPELEDALKNGRAWFGADCPDEKTYGTLTRAEVRRFTDRCVELRSSYQEPEFEIDPIIDVFQSAADRACDIWFTI
ncbi:MAG: hypothetical protein HKN47_07655 [Pirellulaceae bacterium]|nr:hypothetical protein [Pirellulaceae bacterium]